ncbi:MAG: hypothetical protein ACK55H_05515 [Cyanobacteriota bacterium]
MPPTPSPTYERLRETIAKLPGVNYVGGLRQLRRRVPAPHPLPWQGVGRRQAWPLLAGN